MATLSTQAISPRFTWRALLRLAALADAIALGAASIILRDPEPLVLGVVALIGLVLLRYRGGLAGIVLLGLLFADVTFWMLAGTASHLITRQGVLALAIPAALTAISLAGLVAAVAAVVRRSVPEAGGRTAPVMGLATVAFFALVLAAGLVRGPGEPPTRAGEIRLETANSTFSSMDLVADRGDVTIRMANTDLFWHTFTIDELGVDLKVPVGGEQAITFTALPGAYSFYCAVPGHDALLRMRGTLTVR